MRWIATVLLLASCGGGYPAHRTEDEWIVVGPSPSYTWDVIDHARKLTCASFPDEEWGGVLTFVGQMDPGHFGYFSWFPDDVPRLTVLVHPGQPAWQTAEAWELGRFVFEACGWPWDNARLQAWAGWINWEVQNGR